MRFSTFLIYVGTLLLILLVLDYNGYIHKQEEPIRNSRPLPTNRWVDEEARVVCWSRRDNYHSLTCLPCGQVAPGICPASSFDPGHGGSEQ